MTAGSKSSFWKWLLGVVTAVLITTLGWWLTHPGGPLNRIQPTPEPKPILRIVDVQVDTAKAGGTAHAAVSIYNEGKVTGEGCSVWWYSGTKVAQELDQGLLPSEAATSNEFGILPGQTQQIELNSLPYSDLGTFRSYLQAQCTGVNITSIEYYVNVVVNHK